MILYFLFACAPAQIYGVPRAEVFLSQHEVEGVLQIASHKGVTTNEPTCTTIYSLEGVQESCETCSWSVDFYLSLLSEGCIFSDLERLQMQVEEERWLVLEQTGWEQWGQAEQDDEGVWHLIANYALLP